VVVAWMGSVAVTAAMTLAADCQWACRRAWRWGQVVVVAVVWVAVTAAVTVAAVWHRACGSAWLWGQVVVAVGAGGCGGGVAAGLSLGVAVA
jgi:hypothetical protein